MISGAIFCLVSILVCGNQLVDSSTVSENLQTTPECSCYWKTLGAQLEALLAENVGVSVTVIVAINDACNVWTNNCRSDSAILLSLTIILGANITVAEICNSSTPVLCLANVPVECHTCNGVNIINGGVVIKEIQCSNGNIIIIDTTFCPGGKLCVAVTALVKVALGNIIVIDIEANLRLLCNLLLSVRINAALIGGTVFLPDHSQFPACSQNPDILLSLIVTVKIYPKHLTCATTLTNALGDLVTVVVIDNNKIKCITPLITVVVSLDLFVVTPETCVYGSKEPSILGLLTG